MKKKLFILLSLILTLTVILCSCSTEETIVKKTDYLSYEIPESWEYYETDDNSGYYEVSSAATLFYFNYPGDSGYGNPEMADVTFWGFMQGMEDSLNNYELTSKKDFDIGGNMIGYQCSFKDTLDGVDFVNVVVYIVTPEGTEIFNYSVSEYEYEKHQSRIENFVSSIKPLEET